MDVKGAQAEWRKRGEDADALPVYTCWLPAARHVRLCPSLSVFVCVSAPASHAWFMRSPASFFIYPASLPPRFPHCRRRSSLQEAA